MIDRYIGKRPGSSLWQLRLPVPKDVQKVEGRKEITLSLREHDRAMASRKALKEITKWNARWERMREERMSALRTTDAATPAEQELHTIAKDAYQIAIKALRDKAKRRQGHAPDHLAAFIQRSERDLLVLANEIRARDFDRWEGTAARMLEKRGYAVDLDSDWFGRFVEMLAEVTVAAIQVENKRGQGDLGAKPSSAVLDQADLLSRSKETGRRDVPFSNLVADFLRQWKASKGNEKETNTEQQMKATFELFAGYFRDRPIRGVKGAHAAEFYDILKLFNPNWARSPRSGTMSWDELVSAFGQQETGLSTSTMNRHIRTLQRLWDWAHKRGHCEGDNPFHGFSVKLRPGVNTFPYLPWEIDELQMLFDPPPKRADVRELMIAALFTGMRLDEIASLEWNDIRSDVTDGREVAFFRIADAKTPAGVRDVPIHTSLNWLLKRSESGENGRIWPGFNEEGIGKKPGADAGREFSTFKLGRGFINERKAFHSFRKNVTRIMERAGVPENEWAQVFGHERGFTYRVYNPDGISLSRKAEIIELIDYPGLNIPFPE